VQVSNFVEFRVEFSFTYSKINSTILLATRFRMWSLCRLQSMSVKELTRMLIFHLMQLWLERRGLLFNCWVTL